MYKAVHCISESDFKKNTYHKPVLPYTFSYIENGENVVEYDVTEQTVFSDSIFSLYQPSLLPGQHMRKLEGEEHFLAVSGNAILAPVSVENNRVPLENTEAMLAFTVLNDRAGVSVCASENTSTSMETSEHEMSDVIEVLVSASEAMEMIVSETNDGVIEGILCRSGSEYTPSEAECEKVVKSEMVMVIGEMVNGEMVESEIHETDPLFSESENESENV